MIKSLKNKYYAFHTVGGNYCRVYCMHLIVFHCAAGLYYIHPLCMCWLIKLIMKNWFQCKLTWIPDDPRTWRESCHHSQRWYTDWLEKWGTAQSRSSFFRFDSNNKSLNFTLEWLDVLHNLFFYYFVMFSLQTISTQKKNYQQLLPGSCG